MAANTGDLITDTRNAARPNSARVTGGRTAGVTTLACDNLSGWPTASKVHFVTYTIDSSSVPIAGTQLDCSGIVSGNNITSVNVIDGTDTGNSINDVVEMLPTAAWGEDLATALLKIHNRDGTLQAGVVGTSNIAANAITSSLIANGTITGADIAAATILATNLGTDSSWAWTSYAPTFANFTIGNGTVVARYAQVGKTIVCRGTVTLGSTSSMGTSPTVTLPVTSVATGYTGSMNQAIGEGIYQRTGTGFYRISWAWASTTTALMNANGVSTYVILSGITSTVPNTWASTDTFTWQIIYEAA